MEIKDSNSPYLYETLCLYKKIFPEAHEIDINGVKEFLEKGLYRIFISFQSNLVSAGAIISDLIPNHPHLCHLDYVFVNKDLQGKGIGSKFMKDLISYLNYEKKNKTMTLECYDEIIPFYSKFGAYKAIQPSQMGNHMKLYNFLAIPIDPDHKLNKNDMKSLLFALRLLHQEELESTSEDKFIWNNYETKCK